MTFAEYTGDWAQSKRWLLISLGLIFTVCSAGTPLLSAGYTLAVEFLPWLCEQNWGPEKQTSMCAYFGWEEKLS